MSPRTPSATRERENELRALRRKEERTSAQLHKVQEENAKQVSAERSRTESRAVGISYFLTPKALSRPRPSPHPRFCPRPHPYPHPRQAAALKRKNEELIAQKGIVKRFRAEEGPAGGAKRPAGGVTPRQPGVPRVAMAATKASQDRIDGRKDAELGKAVRCSPLLTVTNDGYRLLLVVYTNDA